MDSFTDLNWAPSGALFLGAEPLPNPIQTDEKRPKFLGQPKNTFLRFINTIYSVLNLMPNRNIGHWMRLPSSD